MAKVLVVDDEANLRKVLAAMLRRDGYDVTVAADGEQGLAEFHKNGADIVVTDLVMPKAGGMEVLRAVNAANPDVPVIIITAHGTVDSAVEAIKAGAFDYITKPFDQAELSAVDRQGRQGARRRPALGARRRQGPRRHHRRVAADPRGLQDHRQGGGHPVHRAHHRRERHRQGADRHRAARRPPAAATSRSSRSTAPPSPRTCWSPSSSATSAAPSPAPSPPSPAASSWPTAAPSSSTRLARSPSRCR